MTRPYIIAEMACSHDGTVDLARTIIDGAGRAGADAIQFQIWILGEMMVPHHPDFARVSEIELSREDWASLAAYVRETYPQMEIIACVYERSSVDFCEKIGVDAYKLHSSDLSNPFVVEYVADTGRRIDLSVGASTLGEIERAVETIRGRSDAEIWMMYGYQNFPTPPDAINLAYMMKLKHLFGVPVGYQDHTGGDEPGAFWLPAAAQGMGVDVLEKHITHDRALKGIDHEAALNPDEFAQFVEMVELIAAATGRDVPGPFSPDEDRYRKYSKKSLVAARDLSAGETIAHGDLTFMRAEQLGMPPDQADRLIGRTATRDIARFQLVGERDVR